MNTDHRCFPNRRRSVYIRVYRRRIEVGAGSAEKLQIPFDSFAWFNRVKGYFVGTTKSTVCRCSVVTREFAFLHYHDGMPLLRPEVSTTEFSPNKGLTCPMCGDRRVSFHSRTTIMLSRTVEWVGVFICEDSHAFYVSLKSLQRPQFYRAKAISWQRVEELRRTIRAQVACLKKTALDTKKRMAAHQQLRREIASTINKLQNKRMERTASLLVQ